MTELTQGHLAFRKEVADFAANFVAPFAGEADRNKQLNDGIIAELSQRGYLGITAPVEYDGLGLDDISYALAVEELSRACGSTGILVAAHTSLAVFPIQMFGNCEQKKYFLPRLTRGGKLGAFGLTESDAGSDAAGIRTKAEEVDGGYLLNGRKTFITSGALSDIILVAATEDFTQGTRGISNFIVERDNPGFSPGRKEEKLGLKGSDTSELLFEDCFVPSYHLLGKKKDGFRQFMITLNGGRISIGAMAVGLGQAAIDVVWAYLLDNPYALNKALKKQNIQMTLAEMETRIKAARHLVIHAAWLKSEQKNHVVEAAMAKGYASEAATWAAQQAILICGEEVAMNNHPAHRIWRDARLCEIGEGTTEIQRMVIFRQLLKERAK